MTDPATKQATNNNDLEGLEVIFENNLEGLQEDLQEGVEGSLEDAAVPIAKAAVILGIHRRYALDLLHQGKLEGFKNLKGQWFVKQNSIQSRLEVPPSIPPPDLQEVWLEPSRRWMEGPLEVSQSDPKDKIIKDLQEKLEAATFRIGYMQHQIETQEAEIKLLTDSQYKQGWWTRLKNWLTSDR